MATQGYVIDAILDYFQTLNKMKYWKKSSHTIEYSSVISYCSQKHIYVYRSIISISKMFWFFPLENNSTYFQTFINVPKRSIALEVLY